MRYFLLTLSILFVSSPVMAQEAAPSKSRLELAREMHDIWPIRTRIENAIEGVAEGFPPEDQASVKAALRRAMQFNQIEEASIKAMADIFNEEELTDMIAFYGSQTGRAISAKTVDYENAIRPVLVQMMDRAMLDLRTGQGQ